MPKISVLMSTYNREEYVSVAIESILNQSFQDFEFIIIDDCSTDRTTKIIESYAQKDSRIRLYKNKENRGLIYCLNKGLKLAQAKYIARMDDDDFSLEKRLEIQYDYMETHKNVAVVGTFCEYIGESEGSGWIIEYKPENIEYKMFYGNQILHPSVLIRKQFLDENSLIYPEYAIHAEDYAFWVDIISKGGIITNIPQVLLHYRIHKKRISSEKQSLKIQKQIAEKIKRIYMEKNYLNLVQKTKKYDLYKRLSLHRITQLKYMYEHPIKNFLLNNNIMQFLKDRYILKII